MLSEGGFHRWAPKGRKDNLQWRKYLIEAARNRPAVQRGFWEACRRDLLFYINAFCWTFDPRTRQKFLPFVTWPFQDKAFLDILLCIDEGRDLVIEKSRDMGASWMSLTVMEWLWHFHPGMSFLMVSRKEDLVDAPGDPDSLFWKVDFIHRHLPDWLRPNTDRRKLHFGNLANGSTIDGESTTAAAGVGGRRTAMFIDEFSRIEEGYQLLAGTADTTRCRIFNFTPFGTANAAYKLARRTDVKKLRLHWSEHPEKAAGLYRWSEDEKRIIQIDKSYVYPPDFQFVMDGKLRSPWYDGECRRRANDKEVAEMIDIDYQGSAYQFFDKTTIVSLQQTYCVPAVWDGDVSFDEDTGRPRELVRVSGGPLRLWVMPRGDMKPPPGRYGAGADLATGTGATNSCLSFVNAQTGEKVAEYTTPYLRAEQLAPRAVALCWLFRSADGEPALFAWEMQGPGILFSKRVIELGYRNVYYRQQEEVIPGSRLPSDNPGWFPSPNNKRTLLEEYRSALSLRQFVNRSEVALEECLSFIHTKDGRIEHSEGIGTDDPTGARANHGDRVIADALAWKMARLLGAVKTVQQNAEPHPLSLAWRRRRAEEVRQLEEAEY